MTSALPSHDRRMRRTAILILLSLTACTLPVVEVKQGPIIEVAGTATKTVDATVLRVQMTVSSRDKDRNRAFAAAIRNAGTVKARLQKQFGLSSDDVRIQSIVMSELPKDETSGVGEHKKTDGAPHVEFEGSVHILVSFRSFKQVPEILAQLVEVGVTEINGFSFDVSDSTAEYKLLELEALHQASERAERLARSAGFRRVALLSIDTDAESFLPPGYKDEDLRGNQESISLEQKVLLSTTLNCRFQMLP